MYLNPRTQETHDIHTPLWRDPNDEKHLLLEPLPGINRHQILHETRSLWRYKRAMPLECPQPISLGEGATPLVQRPFANANPHFKLEWFNPTSSFKDRGTSVMLSLLRQQGIRAVLEDSSGNGGASVACYAAAGGLEATIMAPASTSAAKTVQMRAHGATVELIPGSRQATAEAAMAAHGRDGGRLFYASHNWHPFFLQGTKTLAYEMWEDLGFAAPDHVVIPCGAGSNILGCDIGFDELLRAGEIERRPRLWCAQPLLCSPIATAVLAAQDVDDGHEAPAAWNSPAPTMAEGTSIAVPVRLDEVRDAILRSGGGAVRVTEEAISSATLALARAGLYTEPSCAHAAAAYEELVRSGSIASGDVCVIVLTSTGVKATPRIAELLGVTL